MRMDCRTVLCNVNKARRENGERGPFYRECVKKPEEAWGVPCWAGLLHQVVAEPTESMPCTSPQKQARPRTRFATRFHGIALATILW